MSTRIIAIESVATGIRVATIDPISNAYECRLMDCTVVDGFEGGRRSTQYDISPDGRGDYYTVVTPSRAHVRVRPRESSHAYRVAIHHALHETDGDAFALALPLSSDGYFVSDSSAPDLDFFSRLDDQLEMPVSRVEKGKTVSPPYRLVNSCLHCLDLTAALLDWLTVIGRDGKLYSALEVADLTAKKSRVAVVSIEWDSARLAVFDSSWKLIEELREAGGLAEAMTIAGVEGADLASLHSEDKTVLSAIRNAVLSNLATDLQYDTLFVGDGAFMFTDKENALSHRDDPRFASVRGVAKLKRHQMAASAL